MQRQVGFDWLALGMTALIAAFFALTARFNSQPAPSFVPMAVLSATGCGLLVTALRKLRGRPGVGLLEAGLGGLLLALFQFAVSFTYPSLTTILTAAPTYGHAFLITWGLVGLFTVVLSIAGATLGHLAFAPLRPLPAQATKKISAREETGDEGAESSERESADSDAIEHAQENEKVSASSGTPGEENEAEQMDEEASAEEAEADVSSARQRRLFINYAISVLLLGLLPMMVGYVFAAAYDFVMQAIHIEQLSPGFYPTLSLLGGLLPWRTAIAINLSNANGAFIVFTLLWRIPDAMLGNPHTFDVQSLEPLLFNAAALALLLITMYGRESYQHKPQAASWRAFFGLEALLGLVLILPANLWFQRGLEGILQFGGQVFPLPTIYLLTPLFFTLNLVTGVVFCLLVGLVVKRQYQLWTQPREERAEQEQTS